MSNSPFEDIQEAMRIMRNNRPTKPVLVAPNKRVQKQWEKEYPGVEVLLSQPIPEGAIDLGLSRTTCYDIDATATE